MLYWGIVYYPQGEPRLMPLYEYRCNQCGEDFEKMLRFSQADQIPACPHCQSTDTRKKISTVASFGSALGAAAAATGSSCSPRGGFS